MKQLTQVLERAANRRTFLKNSMVAGAVATAGVGILGSGLPAFAQETSNSSIIQRRRCDPSISRGGRTHRGRPLAAIC